MAQLTTARESLHVVFFSKLARTFPASSLNSRVPDNALPKQLSSGRSLLGKIDKVGTFLQLQLQLES